MNRRDFLACAADVGNIPIIEGIPGRTPGIDYSAYRMSNRRFVLPTSRGFGLKLMR